MYDLAYKHIDTKIKIYQNIVCSNCPYKIYANEQEVVNLGIGNIYSNFIFILPTYDNNASIGIETSLTLLSKVYNEITSKNILEEVYITRLVKCYKTVDHDLYNYAVTPCSNYLRYEVNKLSAKHIIFFGKAYDDYINNNNIISLNIPFKNIYKSYSPDVLFYDNPKIKESFINNLTYILSNI